MKTTKTIDSLKKLSSKETSNINGGTGPTRGTLCAEGQIAGIVCAFV